MRLLIRRLADLAAALPAERRVPDFGELSRAARRGWAGEISGLFAHPASYSDTDTTRELIEAYYAT
ncbi:MAG: hypothetical protein L0H94_14495, partial [Nitrospira sp.]|nr:hypothetical protein [Nitrospira sp.]